LSSALAAVSPCAAPRGPGAVLLREPHPVLERVLRRLLQPEVDRQADGVSGLGGRDELALGLWSPERVDADPRLAGNAAKVRVVRPLYSGLPDLIAGLVAVVGER